MYIIVDMFVVVYTYVYVYIYIYVVKTYGFGIDGLSYTHMSYHDFIISNSIYEGINVYETLWDYFVSDLEDYMDDVLSAVWPQSGAPLE